MLVRSLLACIDYLIKGGYDGLAGGHIDVEMSRRLSRILSLNLEDGKRASILNDEKKLPFEKIRRAERFT